jgi:hypothetical protein
MIYQEIYNFCKIRNVGNVFENGDKPTPRLEFLMDLLDREGIKYELDTFTIDTRSEIVTNGYNLNLIGNSDKFVVAHHDINNPKSDNANDNSCSVINAIALKKLVPSINVSILDGEEFGGYGSRHLSERINNGDFGKIDWVLNLELTGIGGESFFIGDYPGPLTDHIKELFDCPVMRTPFNDSVIFNQYGIDSVVINPLPITQEKTPIKNKDDEYLDFKILFRCHSMQDSVDKISTDDMKNFIEKIVTKIIA